VDAQVERVVFHSANARAINVAHSARRAGVCASNVEVKSCQAQAESGTKCAEVKVKKTCLRRGGKIKNRQG
jgi:hypothetical protein